MAGQIAIFEGADMPRKRRRGSARGKSSFSAVAKKCRKKHKKSAKAFWACVKKGQRRGRGKKRKSGRRGHR